MTAPNVATATTSPASSPDSSGAPTSSGEQPRTTAGTFAPKDVRYPADYHVEWMRNKTMDEVASLSNAMYAELVRGQPQAQTAQRPATAPAQQTAQPGTPSAPSNDLWITDPAQAA